MKDQPSSFQLFLSEFIGTALLLLIGLSLVIFMFGTGSPMAEIIPSVTTRRIITGFLFGGWGATISLTNIGKVSGAHINPAVTMVFLLFKKIEMKSAGFYVLGQLTGAIVGCLPLLAWGSMGRSLSFGATTVGTGYSTTMALAGEVITTFIMVSGLVLFIGFRHLRMYTPAIFPIIYAIMVPLEAAISGTSTNPARSLGPAVISGEWHDWWIYWVGPFAGAFLASLALSFVAKQITVAKLYHFDNQQDALLRSKKSNSTHENVPFVKSGPTDGREVTAVK
ncbi:MAG: aquaporin [Cyclobacteriaceae bacterium]|nr:aquaporin [Cyclobacteriaceae bacterium]